MSACPKCGFVQQEGEECGRCGVVFSKLRRAYLPPEPPDAEEPVGGPKPGLFRRFYRVFRWVSLGVLVVVLVLVLRGAPPPAVQTAPDARERASAKVEEFTRAAQIGAPSQLQLNEAELNGWVQSNVAVKSQPRAADIARAVMSGEPPSVPAPASNVSDIRMNLVDDRIRAWVRFEVHGLDMTLELEGRLSTRDGYVRLRPTSGRLGSLPLSQAMLDGAARRLFESAENREKFRLPEGIGDIRVENSELTITAR